MAGHNDPKLLYAINGIHAYTIVNGTETHLTPQGPQTLSLLMVPTSSPFNDLSTPSGPGGTVPEEDFYLHLHLPPELDLPLPATTQVYHQPPSSYLIPRWDHGPDSGRFTRIEFPPIGKGGSQDDVDTFETILAQCTAFLERAPPPREARARRDKEREHEKGLPAYNPSEFGPGEAYVNGSSSSHHGGQIVLIDEENGSVVGELSQGFNVVEDAKMTAGSKDPVMITLPSDGSHDINVAPASDSYLEMAMHPAYKSSTLVSKAAMASRLIVTGSSYVSKTLTSQADSFTKKVKPNEQPMTFTPTTHARIRKVHTFSEGAAGLSAKTVGQVSKYAQNIGATLARKGDKDKAAKGADYKPGLLNKSLMAFSTIADGIDQAGRNLLASTSTAATTVVGHKYGAEAGEITQSIGGGVKNVGLVYIDAAGVSRRAIVKSVAKGMIVGKVKGGGNLVVGGGDGGSTVGVGIEPGQGEHSLQGEYASYQERDEKERAKAAERQRNAVPETVGFGRAAPPPSYHSGVGEPIEGSRAVGREKR